LIEYAYGLGSTCGHPHIARGVTGKRGEQVLARMLNGGAGARRAATSGPDAGSSPAASPKSRRVKMKHVNLAFTGCNGCPFCDVEVHDGENTYWCQKLQKNAHSSWWGKDNVLPGCPLDEYEPRDGDQIDKYYHLMRKESD